MPTLSTISKIIAFGDIGKIGDSIAIKVAGKHGRCRDEVIESRQETEPGELAPLLSRNKVPTVTRMVKMKASNENFSARQSDSYKRGYPRESSKSAYISWVKFAGTLR